MSHPFSEIEESIIPYIGKTMKCIDYFVSESLHSAGISLSKVQMVLLVKLVQNDGQPQFNLAWLTDRDKASLTRLIGTMEKKGLVTRVSSKSDKRVKNVYITPLGRETLTKALPVMKKMVTQLQKDISKEELDITKRVMDRIKKNLHGDDDCFHIIESK